MTVEEEMAIVADNIRKNRINKGFSQLDLSNEANLSQSFLANLESGKKKPSVHTIVRIAKALDISPRDFFPEAKTKTSDDIKKEIITLVNQL